MTTIQKHQEQYKNEKLSLYPLVLLSATAATLSAATCDG